MERSWLGEISSSNSLISPLKTMLMRAYFYLFIFLRINPASICIPQSTPTSYKMSSPNDLPQTSPVGFLSLHSCFRTICFSTELYKSSYKTAGQTMPLPWVDCSINTKNVHPSPGHLA